MSNNTGATFDSDSFEKEILRLSSEFPELMADLLEKMSEYYDGELIKSIPYSENSLTGIHLKDATLVKQSKKALEVSPKTNIGFTNDPKEHGWQAHFTNYGTIHQKGQHWLENVNNRTKEPIIDIYKSGLEGFLNGRN